MRRGDFTCTRCGGDTWRPLEVAGHDGSLHKTLGLKACADCDLAHPAHLDVMKTEGASVDVAKDMDSSETAVQRQDVEHKVIDLVGHRTGCPRGGSAPCGGAVDGRCQRCDARVQDHDAVGKTLAQLRALAAQ